MDDYGDNEDQEDHQNKLLYEQQKKNLLLQIDSQIDYSRVDHANNPYDAAQTRGGGFNAGAKAYHIHSENIRGHNGGQGLRLDQTRDEGISNSNCEQFILLESPEIAATGFELGQTNRFNTLIRRARTQLSPDQSVNEH